MIVLIFGFIRQVTIAKEFGASFEMDVYYIAYAVCTILVITPGALFEHVAIPKLKIYLDSKTKVEFNSFSLGLIFLSILASLILVFIFYLVSPLLSQIMTSGFNSEEKNELIGFLRYFIPWLLVYPIYNSIASILKSMSSYKLVVFSEIIYVSVSYLAILSTEDDVSVIPISQFYGHLVASLILFMVFLYNTKFKFSRQRITFQLYRDIVVNAGILLISHPLKIVTSIVERNYQSLLSTGSISSFGYASQIINAMSSVLSFKQIYMVPLSKEQGREVRLLRLLVGLGFLTIPIAVTNSIFSYDIISIIYGGGSFDQASIDKTSMIYSVLALSLVSSTLNIPILRMFQVINRVKFTVYVNTFSMLILFSLFFIFVTIGKLDVLGYAISITANSLLCFLICIFYLVYNCKFKLAYIHLLFKLLRLSILLIIGVIFKGYVADALSISGLLTDIVMWGVILLLIAFFLIKDIKFVLGK